LAETAMNARQFTQAAAYYQSLLRLAPADLSAQNLLGYAYAFAGDLDSSMKAFDIYRRQPGQEPNALDSMGEAYFINGRFADAERFFLQANEKDAAMLGGGDLLKAAYAHYLSSRNAAAADPIFNRFAAVRAQAKDPILEWKKSAWLYGTGRADQAKSELEAALRSAQSAQVPSQFTDLARKQLAVWNAPPPVFHDLGQLKRAYQSTTPSTDGLARTFYAEALLASGQREQAQKLVRTWPLPDTAGDPVLQPFLYPRFLELRDRLK
jgi:tetratricopeptide (TPR) repeat protein